MSRDSTVTAGADAPEEHVLLGEVHGVFGVRGWIKVRSFTRPTSGLFEYPRLSFGRDSAEFDFRLKNFRADGDNFIVQLAGLTTRESAEALVGMRITVPISALPRLNDASFYWRDLIGLRVINLEQQPLGVVTGLVETGAADVLLVDGERQRLIPFVLDRYIQSVDLTNQIMTVDWHPDD